MVAEPWFLQFQPDQLAPTCDRCGEAKQYAVMDLKGPSRRVYCADCLTMVEKRCCDVGVSPFEPEES